MTKGEYFRLQVWLQQARFARQIVYNMQALRQGLSIFRLKRVGMENYHAVLWSATVNTNGIQKIRVQVWSMANRNMYVEKEGVQNNLIRSTGTCKKVGNLDMFIPEGYSQKFWIGVCREGSWTVTLFKDSESENYTLFKAQNLKMTPYSKLLNLCCKPFCQYLYRYIELFKKKHICLGGRFLTPVSDNTI